MSLDVDEIVSKMLTVYAECSAYRDTGQMAVALGGKTIESYEFWTCIDISNTFHSLIIDSKSDELYSLVFGNQKDAFECHSPDFRLKSLKTEEAVQGCPEPEICQLPRRTLALLFMPHPSRQALMERDGFEYLGLNPVDSEPCHHLRHAVSWEFVSMVSEEWISATRFILRKQRHERRVEIDGLLSFEGSGRYTWILKDVAEQFDVRNVHDLPKSKSFKKFMKLNGSTMVTSVEVVHSIISVESSSTHYPSAA